MLAQPDRCVFSQQRELQCFTASSILSIATFERSSPRLPRRCRATALEAHVVGVLAPFLEQFLAASVARQTKAWAGGASTVGAMSPIIPLFGDGAPASEADVRQLFEVASEASLRHVSRAFAEYLRVVLGVADALIPAGVVGAGHQSNYKPVCDPSRLREILLSHPPCAGAIVEALSHCISCPDAPTCSKAADVATFILDQLLSAAAELRESICARLLRSCLGALFEPSAALDGSAQHSLIGLVNALFCSEVMLVPRAATGISNKRATLPPRVNEHAKAIMLAIQEARPTICANSTSVAVAWEKRTGEVR